MSVTKDLMTSTFHLEILPDYKFLKSKAVD